MPPGDGPRPGVDPTWHRGYDRGAMGRRDGRCARTRGALLAERLTEQIGGRRRLPRSN
jgi:hypothetical protein